MKPKLQPSGILMGMDGALDSRSQHFELLLRAVANLDERRRWIDDLAAPENRNQQVLARGLGRKALPSSGIERINDVERGRQRAVQVVDCVADKLVGGAETAHLKDAG